MKKSIVNSIERIKHGYAIKDEDGKIIAKAEYYEFKMKNFDWVLLANVETKPEYRGQGMATKLVNKIYDYVSHTIGKGLYLLVKPDNYKAIKLYKKLNFTNVKKCTLKDGPYLIMAKGDPDRDQIIKMNFR